MKRKEEIENAAHQKYPYEGGIKGMICENSIPIFIQGAEWADKTMMKRLENWLKAHIKFETVTYSDVWDVSVVDVLATDFTTVDEMEESFRKAMEE